MREDHQHPEELGLYRREEHDACGVGFVAQLDAPPSHRVVQHGLECLQSLTHRGGVDADGASGDGAGLLLQLPSAFFASEARRLDFGFNPDWRIAVGVFFLPRDGVARVRAMFIAEEAVRRRGLYFAGWRQVPVDERVQGLQAQRTQPSIWHLLVAQPPDQERDFEQLLYLTRKEIERRLREVRSDVASTYIPSFSSRSIVYKGLLAPSQLGRFYCDLSHPEFAVSAAVFHQRYSTNTAPSWFLAQPFRLIAHNGEINTLRGNRHWMRVREAVLAHPLWGNDIEWLKPVVQPGGSDSADFDNVVELLTRSGRSVHQTLLMMIPEAWESLVEIPSDVKAFYRYHACLIEPWDGPAAMAFLDGPLVGAVLDRNGLRPARYIITHDGLVVLGSEVGLLPIEPQHVKQKGRLGPGQILLVDLQHQKILFNDQVKRQVSRGRKYRKWVARNMIFVPRLKSQETVFARSGGSCPATGRERAAFAALRKAAGYTEEDIELLIKPMAAEKKEPVGSMGDDTPIAALSHFRQPLYHYFRQMFAQVTNPPIDPLRESLVMSLNIYLGPRPSVLTETPQHAGMIRLESPFLFAEELAALRKVTSDRLKSATVSTLFDASEGVEGFLRKLETLPRACSEAVKAGSSILIVSDRGMSAERAALPALLAVAAVTEHLLREGVANRADVVVETAEAWESHQFACLIGYGAAAVNPYAGAAIVADLARRGKLGEISVAEALGNFRAAIEAGLKKVLSKMGISTLSSYRGGKFFEILGLDAEVVERFFPETRSLLGGRKLIDVANDTLERHRNAFNTPSEGLELSGFYRYRRGLERHSYSPEVVRHLQEAAKRGDLAAYHALTDEIESREPIHLRDLLRFRSSKPIPLDEVEPVEAICKRFTTQAMSLGALSPEAHRAVAIAMNRLGAKSNTGEGGEDAEVYIELAKGDSAENKIKQVASGRFGVTPEYLVRARELEIKMAQGSKPGEGGQLPAHKVTPFIAHVRRAVEGIALISPPPHHDIYSIEDLAQLIYDLREVNPQAEICVKLVSQAGVGTVAAGVAKASADIILISGHDGGTGASPLISIKNTASPWEMGLAEVHQALVANGLRDRVRLRVDGGLKTGRDVVVAAILGADEYGFGTSALVALGCVMARQCHMNTCPVGVATQRTDLRQRFPNDPQRLVSYFHHVASHVRELLAQLGYRSLKNIVGRTGLLVSAGYRLPGRCGQLNPEPLLVRPAHGSGGSASTSAPPSARHFDDLAVKMRDDVNLMLCEGRSISREYLIHNTNRTIGARAAGEIALRHGNRGLPELTAEFRFVGSAGQSFGAFLTEGLRLILEGEANDYVGKGMGGGEIIIRPPKGSTFASQENVIMGNAVLYGATAGALYAAGRAGERFCVRNSGATAVVEGTGDHACEYMTGGMAVILGQTGRNFGAGMTSGVAFVYDPGRRFEHRYNPALVRIERIIEPEDSHFLRQLVLTHARKTLSTYAWDLLENWSATLLNFWKVVPRAARQPAPQPTVRVSSAKDSGLLRSVVG